MNKILVVGQLWMIYTSLYGWVWPRIDALFFHSVWAVLNIFHLASTSAWHTFQSFGTEHIVESLMGMVYRSGRDMVLCPLHLLSHPFVGYFASPYSSSLFFFSLSFIRADAFFDPLYAIFFFCLSCNSTLSLRLWPTIFSHQLQVYY